MAIAQFSSWLYDQHDKYIKFVGIAGKHIKFNRIHKLLVGWNKRDNIPKYISSLDLFNEIMLKISKVCLDYQK